MKRTIPPALSIAPPPNIVSTSWWAEPKSQASVTGFHEALDARLKDTGWGQFGNHTLSSYGPYDLPRRKGGSE